MRCIFCGEKACKISASHKSCWHCLQPPGSCVMCVSPHGVPESLQAAGAAGVTWVLWGSQLCLVMAAGVGKEKLSGAPKESCSRNSTFSQHRDTWEHGTRREITPIQTKRFKAFVSLQAAAVEWDRGICALSIGAGDRNANRITAGCLPAFGIISSQGITQATDPVGLFCFCPITAHTCCGLVWGTPGGTITSVGGFRCPQDAECSELCSSRRFRKL